MMKQFSWILLATLIGVSGAWAGRKKAKQETPLTEVGKQLEARYTAAMKALKAEIEAALPTIDPQKKAAYLKAREAEKTAEARRNEAKQKLGKVNKARGLVGHAKNYWIPKAEKGIAKTKAKLKQAKTAAEREAAKKELAKWQANKEAGQQALKERQAAYDKAKAEEPKFQKELDAAEEALVQARTQTLQAVKNLGLQDFLASNELDAKLAKYVVLSHATPRGLAQFAQQGDKQQKLVEALLGDHDLMLQMVVADGAEDGKYGQAMEIYTDIQKVSPKAKEGVLKKLAVAVSLEHAVPVSQRNPKAAVDAPKTVDPVKRYLHYEKAYLADELDPAFDTLSTWDYRFVVNGNEPNETLAWGRKMLRNYRPDHITTPDYRWRYVAAVRTDIRYGSQDNKYDKPELQFFQNILMNGGVCGRRAFFGRFMLRAFGVPTTARPQRGHAALAHWTPQGWVVCLGGGWGSGWTKTRYNKDRDFLANTQARENREDFLQVKRAQWVGKVVGEKPVYGFLSGDPGFWYGVSLYRQRAIIEEAKAVELAAVGEDIGEANESKVKQKIEDVTVEDENKKITVQANGVITIPAVACSKPTNNTRKIKFMPSNLGGMQLHYGRQGGHEEFEYTFDAPKAGIYKLTARVVTPSWKQHLFVAANGAKELVDIALPHTVGLWDETEPVEITLKKGKNVLTFSRKHDGLKGVTIKQFTLTPVK